MSDEKKFKLAFLVCLLFILFNTVLGIGIVISDNYYGTGLILCTISFVIAYVSIKRIAKS